MKTSLQTIIAKYQTMTVKQLKEIAKQDAVDVRSMRKDAIVDDLAQREYNEQPAVVETPEVESDTLHNATPSVSQSTSEPTRPTGKESNVAQSYPFLKEWVDEKLKGAWLDVRLAMTDDEQNITEQRAGELAAAKVAVMMSDEYEQLERDAKAHVCGKSAQWEGDSVTHFYDTLQETCPTYRSLLQDWSGNRAMLIDEQDYREEREKVQLPDNTPVVDSIIPSDITLTVGEATVANDAQYVYWRENESPEVTAVCTECDELHHAQDTLCPKCRAFYQQGLDLCNRFDEQTSRLLQQQNDRIEKLLHAGMDASEADELVNTVYSDNKATCPNCEKEYDADQGFKCDDCGCYVCPDCLNTEDDTINICQKCMAKVEAMKYGNLLPNWARRDEQHTAPLSQQVQQQQMQANEPHVIDVEMETLGDPDEGEDEPECEECGVSAYWHVEIIKQGVKAHEHHYTCTRHIKKYNDLYDSLNNSDQQDEDTTIYHQEIERGLHSR